MQTVIVLGAGASAEVGLPVGLHLKQRVADLLDLQVDGNRLTRGDPLIVRALREFAGRDGSKPDIRPFVRAAHRIRDAMPQAISIDNYLDAHKGDNYIELCAKLAIVRAILAAERESRLYVNLRSNKGIDHRKLADTWFNGFLQLLTENCRVGQLEERLGGISVVVFNYDRCFEQYLYYALQTYYSIAAEESAALLKGLRIFHPYGNAGTLPWLGRWRQSDFGEDLDPSRLLLLADGIKTFAQGMDSAIAETVAIRRTVANADRLIFLGFAFHRINMDLLWDRKCRPANGIHARCFATGKGISQSDIQAIVEEISELSRMRDSAIKVMADLSCSELIREYWRTLSFV